jgi:pentatricopeptide repeat protein
MRMAQVQPQAITFTELIRCLANRKQFYVRAFEIFSQMRSFGVRPDEYVIAALLYATAKQVRGIR